MWGFMGCSAKHDTAADKSRSVRSSVHNDTARAVVVIAAIWPQSGAVKEADTLSKAFVQRLKMADRPELS